MQKLTILFDADNVAENLLDRWLDILNKRYRKTRAEKTSPATIQKQRFRHLRGSRSTLC